MYTGTSLHLTVGCISLVCCQEHRRLSTLGVHVQRGLQYFVHQCVCVSLSSCLLPHFLPQCTIRRQNSDTNSIMISLIPSSHSSLPCYQLQCMWKARHHLSACTDGSTQSDLVSRKVAGLKRRTRYVKGATTRAAHAEAISFKIGPRFNNRI